MERNILFITLKKYQLLILLLLSLFLLGGCGNNFTPIDSSSTGFFDHYFVYPFSLLIKKVAFWFQGNYGIAIVLITISIRFVLMPFLIRQSRSSKESQDKMAILRPEIDLIQEKYKGKKSTEDQLSMQRELSDLYKKHDFNPVKMATGCLPLIIQTPFLIGFYYAIRRTPEIAEQSFLWFNLGETDILFVVLAAIIYYIQARVGLIGLEEIQRKQMAIMGLISPIMIGVISLNVPAALPLYWAVGGLFMIVQTLIIKKYVY
ncbi:OxaA precursor [Ammoniphilus oxalaticus]|uniref:Membrane protein insertase YidC n=1 Tax=Ammoniphilus oxalaticus TaxID=66863 RepID=A0A419SRB6_9BACL|nr:membrane protein insertase YidC [Ammoniphilus oxalaticus]RKD27078.1 OxaA precursor [Ammoniphilus oxalaticus]